MKRKLERKYKEDGGDFINWDGNLTFISICLLMYLTYVNKLQLGKIIFSSV